MKSDKQGFAGLQPADSNLNSPVESVDRQAKDEILFPNTSRYSPYHARQGGMGVAFFCYDTLKEKKLVLKTFRDELVGQHRVRLRFLNESSEWIFLGAHPNIVQAYRVEALGSPPKPYLVLECIEPELSDSLKSRETCEFDVSLAHLIKSQTTYALSFERSLMIALQVAHAMQYAGERIPGLIHRDIKPDNILLDARGNALLSDFGLARSFAEFAATPDDYLQQYQQLGHGEFKPAGSPMYIAPEQWEVSNIADCRVDIYALGLTLFEMITGKKHVLATDLNSARKSHVSGLLRPVPEQVPASLRIVIERCTALDPNDRYSDWNQVIAAISSCYCHLTNELPPEVERVHGNKVDENVMHIESYLAISNSYQNLGYAETALRYAEVALDVAKKIKHSELQVNSLNQQALLLDITGEPATAVMILQNSLALVRTLENDEKIIETLLLLGGILSHVPDYTQAQTILTEAGALAEAINRTDIKLLALGNLANVSAELGDTQAAIDSFQEQLNHLQAMDDSVNATKCLSNLGNAYLDSKNNDQAIECFSQSLQQAVELVDVISQAQALKGLSQAFELKGDGIKAQSWMEQYHQLCVQWNDNQEQAWAKSELQRLLGNGTAEFKQG